MQTPSNAVKDWRRRTKERIILSMGGKCCICGYNKCPSALALHHLDPKQKEITFGRIRANPRNWQFIVAELKKCILVCHNCHCEIHANYINPLEKIILFDTKFTDYKSLIKKEDLHPCPICSKPTENGQKTCSIQCAAVIRRNIEWDKIDLVEELKYMSILALSKKLGCSDALIHKRLKKLNLKEKIKQNKET